MARRPDFINVQRRFCWSTEQKLRNSEDFIEFSEDSEEKSVSWQDLLAHERVILLAEAGSGKTKEMYACKRQLVEEGKFAFFIPLEELYRDFFLSLESRSDQEKFTEWKADGNALGWFFLDAVDELKLTEGTLRTALGRLSEQIGGNMGRAKVIISCRPSDWRADHDLNIVQQRLPVPEGVRAARPIESDRTDPGVLDDMYERETPDGSEPNSQSGQGVVRTALMLPLSNMQVGLFANAANTEDAAAFLEELTKQNAWSFARRPLDLLQLIDTWETSGKLGTREEQHKTNVVTRLKEANPDRPGTRNLTDDNLRLGARRLALALALTRTRTLRLPEQSLDHRQGDSSLEPSSILTDWTPDDRKALLSTGLFDPATYGRVRFHHRSVQEYLAACRLWDLRQRGMPVRALFRLLFRDIYGLQVVFPSMREIAAWLALWDPDVCRELIRREPESLLSLGDPESLDIAEKRDLIRAFSAAYGGGSGRGLRIPTREVSRLAHPELAPVIRECWGDGPTNVDVLELLLELIRTGPIESCADLAHAVATDTQVPPDLRIDAIRALVSCGKRNTVRTLVDGMLDIPTCWPARIIHAVAGDMFPTIIGVNELIALMERTPEPSRWRVGGFEFYARRIVSLICPWSELSHSLRDGIADLIWRGRRHGSRSLHDARSEFGHLTPALAKLCGRQLAETSVTASDKLIRASVLACRFGSNVTDVEDSIPALRACFRADMVLRQKAFWADLAVLDEIAPSTNDWGRFHRAMNNGLLKALVQTDRSWLLAALADEDRENPERRAVALHALIWLWLQSGRAEFELDDIRDRLNGEITLTAILDQALAPPTPEQEAEEARHQALYREHEEKKVCNDVLRRRREKKLRRYLHARTEEAFARNKLKRTMKRLYRWFQDRSRSYGPLESWDMVALSETFGTETAVCTEAALRMFWRTFPPKPWSDKAANEKNVVFWHTILGLVGVETEASTPGWTSSLTSDDARTAVAHAMTRHGLAPYITRLTESHPTETEEVIGAEVSAELRFGEDYDHLPTLQALTHAEGNLKQLCVPRLLAALQSWPCATTPENGCRWALHLNRVLRILSEAREAEVRETIVRLCVDHFSSHPTGPLAFTWLRGLFRFDAIRGADILIKQLLNADTCTTGEYAVGAFAALLDDDHSLVFRADDARKRARALGRLVRLSHEHVRIEDDIVHDGVFSPGTRDQAETVRRRLEEMLFATPGPEAHQELLELCTDELFASWSDRLRQRVKERAAFGADFPPYSPDSVIALEERYEVPPSDSNGLFSIMMDRLDDIAHELTHGDFSNRRTLKRISEESEMQRTLAGRLEDKANGAYKVTREDEVVDGRKADIRLSSVNGNQVAVIEVKIADRRWSLGKLRSALREQLVDGYLRDTKCRVGCLLLTCHRKNKYWIHPETQKRINFFDMVEYMKGEAQSIAQRDCREIRISVFGLDLTGP